MQVRSIVKKPWLARTFPNPWQVGQVTGIEPASAPAPAQASQVTDAGTRICAVLPAKASASEISILYLRSDPRSLAPRQGVQDFGHRGRKVRAKAVARTVGASTFESRVAELIISRALLRVFKRFVGL